MRLLDTHLADRWMALPEPALCFPLIRLASEPATEPWIDGRAGLDPDAEMASLSPSERISSRSLAYTSRRYDYYEIGICNAFCIRCAVSWPELPEKRKPAVVHCLAAQVVCVVPSVYP